MACAKIKAMVILVMGLCCLCFGAVYRVGDSAGWTILGHINYTKWASGNDFHIGDTLLFEYNKLLHDVVRVRHRDYESCSCSSPIASYNSGNDSIILKRPGHFYFLCGSLGHCQLGQKVAIHVSIFPGPVSSRRSPADAVY